jgi:hypothetical protein
MSADALATYLDLLFGAEPAGAFLEVRWRLPDSRGMGQLWRPVERKITAIDSIRSIGAKTDVYVGCAPRTRQYGGKDAVERAHALWADCDSSESLAALERFEPAPGVVICSGSGRHAYWALWPPAEAVEIERANRRLAHALGADVRATDAGRILRPPGTCNFKTGEPVPVEVEHLALEVYALEDVVGKLADPVAERSAWAPVAAPTAVDYPLATIPPPLYVELLTGREPGRDGKIACPFHDDRTPSLEVYDDPARGWFCFGCERGGTIIDFGAALFGIEPRGASFGELRRRLAAGLLGRAAA